VHGDGREPTSLNLWRSPLQLCAQQLLHRHFGAVAFKVDAITNEYAVRRLSTTIISSLQSSAVVIIKTSDGLSEHAATMIKSAGETCWAC